MKKQKINKIECDVYLIGFQEESRERMEEKQCSKGVKVETFPELMKNFNS